MKKLCYWNNVAQFNQGLIQECSKQITELLSGDYRAAGLDTKKVDGYKLWTVWINRSDRLLFSEIKVGNESFILVLEKISNHDYQYSHFLRNNVYKNFKNTSIPEIKQSILDQQLIDNNNSKQSSESENRHELTDKSAIDLRSEKQKNLHPLLQENTSTLREQKFSSSFDGREFFLKDHQVNGEKVLPAVIFLEMIREAVRHASPEIFENKKSIQQKIRSMWKREWKPLFQQKIHPP